MSKRYMVTYTATFFDQRVVSAEDETTARDMITTSLSHSSTSEHKIIRVSELENYHSLQLRCDRLKVILKRTLEASSYYIKPKRVGDDHTE